MKEQNEIFKDIQGYEDYQVSNLGRVKSLKFGKERILKSHKHHTGYYTVELCKNKKQKEFRIHILVAMTFLDHVPNGHKTVVDHINEIKHNNRLENLQLITQRKNIIKSRLSNDNLTSKYTGVCFCKRYKKWLSQIEINKKKINLGRFIDEIEASEMYNKALELKDHYNGCNKSFRELVKSSI